MKFDPTVDWCYKYPQELFQIEFSFSSDLATSETLSSCTASIYDSENETDYTSAMISSVSTSSPKCFFTVGSGSSGKTYQVKLAGVTSDSHTLIHYVALDVFDSVTINTKIGDANANSYVTIKEANDIIRNKYGHKSIWDTLSLEGKKRVMIEATDNFELYNYIGEKYYDSQRLQFPRDDNETVDGDCATPFSINSFAHADLYDSTYNEIPANYWKYGTCHITLGSPLRNVRNIASSNVADGVVTMDEDFTATPNANTDFIIFAPFDKEIKDAQCAEILNILRNTDSDTLADYQNAGAKEVEIGDVKVKFGQSGTATQKVGISPEAKRLLSRWIKRHVKVLRA